MQGSVAGDPVGTKAVLIRDNVATVVSQCEITGTPYPTQQTPYVDLACIVVGHRPVFTAF